jgi:hypothetical protein
MLSGVTLGNDYAKMAEPILRERLAQGGCEAGERAERDF